MVRRQNAITVPHALAELLSSFTANAARWSLSPEYSQPRPGRSVRPHPGCLRREKNRLVEKVIATCPHPGSPRPLLAPCVRPPCRSSPCTSSYLRLASPSNRIECVSDSCAFPAEDSLHDVETAG